MVIGINWDAIWDPVWAEVWRQVLAENAKDLLLRGVG
jgi:hypothetical protein